MTLMVQAAVLDGLVFDAELPFVDVITKNSSPFDPLIDDMQRRALEKWEVSNISVDRLDYGSLNFGGREIMGVILQLNVDMKNRIVGKFSTDCHIVRAAF